VLALVRHRLLGPELLDHLDRLLEDRQARLQLADVLLELADSQISYRQRYVMIAALAPVIDLVMLDPNNPRSVIFQLDRIETHLGALPRRNSTGRLSPVQQIAASIATRLRTADAAKIDDALIMEIEQSLMKLSDAISAAYLTNNERSDSMWEALT
jgi:uncharacterized alpha-E superfamily protein